MRSEWVAAVALVVHGCLPVPFGRMIPYRAGNVRNPLQLWAFRVQRARHGLYRPFWLGSGRHYVQHLNFTAAEPAYRIVSSTSVICATNMAQRALPKGLVHGRITFQISSALSDCMASRSASTLPWGYSPTPFLKMKNRNWTGPTQLQSRMDRSISDSPGSPLDGHGYDAMYSVSISSSRAHVIRSHNVIPASHLQPYAPCVW